MKFKSGLLITILAACFLASCGSEKKEAALKETAKEEAHGEGEENKVTLTGDQIKAIGIQLGTIEHKQLTASVKANGFLKVPNNNKANATSLFGGVVKSLLIQEGDYVRKGQTIAVIANPQFIQMQEEYLTTVSKILLAEQEYERQKELTSGNAGAMKNLQGADATLKALRTRKAALYQQIKLMGINPDRISNSGLSSSLAVTAPISGTISGILVNIGSYVDVSAPVAEIVDNSQLHLDLQIYEKDLPKVKTGQVIHFTLTNNAGTEYDAEIFSIGTAFENNSKTIPVHAKVKGAKPGLIDGMNITANISLGLATLPAVPSDAIVSYQGKDYIYVVTEGHTHGPEEKAGTDTAAEKNKDHDHEAEGHTEEENGVTFLRIPVAKGTTDVGYSEITLLANVPEDAQVVVKGAFFILAKQTNSGEHEH